MFVISWDCEMSQRGIVKRWAEVREWFSFHNFIQWVMWFQRFSPFNYLFPFTPNRNCTTRRSPTQWILPIRFFWWRNKIWLLHERRESLQGLRVDIITMSFGIILKHTIQRLQWTVAKRQLRVHWTLACIKQRLFGRYRVDQRNRAEI